MSIIMSIVVLNVKIFYISIKVLTINSVSV